MNNRGVGIQPELAQGEYVFISLPAHQVSDLHFEPLSSFKEAEGLSLVVERQTAEVAGLEYGSVWSLITLQVFSDLESVGLIARVATSLAAAGISVNPIAAYHHDHLLVPRERAEEALALLQTLTIAEQAENQSDRRRSGR